MKELHQNLNSSDGSVQRFLEMKLPSNHGQSVVSRLGKKVN